MDYKKPGIVLGTLGLGAVAFAIGAAFTNAGARGRAKLRDALGMRGREGHVPTDLIGEKPHPGPHHRAPEAFRPDPTAPVSASEREAFQPATIHLERGPAE